MPVLYSLTPELRLELKKPIGTLVQGSFAETMKRFKAMMEKEKPTAVISVGDTVSRNLVENNVFPQLLIVDNKVMRKNTQPIPLTSHKTIHVKNPPGTITVEAFSAIQEALKSNCQVKIVVDGEEDLLTLIAVLTAPENAVVVYGQPYEGIVVVRVTPEKRAEVAEVLRAIEHARKAK